MKVKLEKCERFKECKMSKNHIGPCCFKKFRLYYLATIRKDQ